MNEFLLKILNVDAEIPQGAETEVVWNNLPSGIWVLLLIALLIFVAWGIFYLYRREMDTCSKPIKHLLAGLRCLAALVIVVILLNPMLEVSKENVIEPMVILLVDDSMSMGLPDQYADEALIQKVQAATGWSPEEIRKAKRAEILERLLARDNGKFLSDLANKGRLRVMTFGQDVVARPISEGPGADVQPTVATNDPEVIKGDSIPPIKLDAAQRSTNINRAIQQALKSESRNARAPIAAVIVMTDGANNEGGAPEDAAELARSKYDTQVFTVGIGDPSRPKNLRVADVITPPSAFKEDPMEIKVKLEAEQLAGSSANVKFYIQEGRIGDLQGARREIASKRVEFDEDLEEKDVVIEYQPTESGKYVITAEVADDEIPNESILLDNSQSASMEVLDDKARVLLIAGGPSWEYRMLQTLLTRDKQIDVSVWLQTLDAGMKQEGNSKIVSMPREIEKLAEYDVILLLDPDPIADRFRREEIEAWQKFLDGGGGILYMAGQSFTHDFVTTPSLMEPLNKIMPVNFGNVDSHVSQLYGRYETAWPLVITPEGTDSSLMRLNTDPLRNKAIWEGLPPIFWTFPAEEAKPDATVLIEHGDPTLRTKRTGIMRGRPLLVVGQYGPGRVVYMGFNGTWRWRQAGEAYFDRFWIQMVRYLLEGKADANQKRGRILLKKDVFTVGNVVSITAELKDEKFNPLQEEEVIASVSGADMEPREVILKPVPEKPGEYSGVFQASGLGEHRIEIAMSGGAEIVMLERKFKVALPRTEINNRRLNREQLAAISKRGGGQIVEIDQLSMLPTMIEDRTVRESIPLNPIELWNNWLPLALLGILLTLEWAIRKATKLL